jgi:hypothetical protein
MGAHVVFVEPSLLRDSMTEYLKEVNSYFRTGENLRRNIHKVTLA